MGVSIIQLLENDENLNSSRLLGTKTTGRKDSVQRNALEDRSPDQLTSRTSSRRAAQESSATLWRRTECPQLPEIFTSEGLSRHFFYHMKGSEVSKIAQEDEARVISVPKHENKRTLWKDKTIKLAPPNLVGEHCIIPIHMQCPKRRTKLPMPHHLHHHARSSKRNSHCWRKAPFFASRPANVCRHVQLMSSPTWDLGLGPADPLRSLPENSFSVFCRCFCYWHGGSSCVGRAS